MYSYKGLAFCGGGVLGGAHVGALKEAVKMFDISKVTHVAGSSAGSMIAGLCACRIPIDDIEQIVTSIDFKSLLDDDMGVIRDAMRLYKKFGYYKGNELEKMYGDILKKYTGDENITLKNIYEMYGVFLIIPVTEMFKTVCKTIYFTPDNHPDEQLKTVVRYSSSYPFVFASKNYYSDGGILDNYPIRKLSEYVSINEILGFRFKNPKHVTERPDNVIDFSIALITGISNKADDITEDELNQTIAIGIRDYSSMDFDLTDEDKQILIQLGMEATVKFFGKLV